MSLQDEIARQAALLVVDEGLEYGSAKRKVLKQLRLGTGRGVELPDNDAVEREVRLLLDEQDDPAQRHALASLRRAALQLMRSLRDYRPHLSGAVWRGTATAHSDIHLQLFHDDTKQIEIELANRGVDYHVSSAPHYGGRGTVDTLSFTVPFEAPGQVALAHLTLYGSKDERGALKAMSNGRPDRGNLDAVEKLLAENREFA